MMELLKSNLFLTILVLFFLTGCELDTRIRVSTENPPRFTFSGNGSLAQFFVSGPYSLDELKLLTGKNIVNNEELSRIKQIQGDNDRLLWQLAPVGASSIVSNLPAMTYGELPTGFKQVFPKEGKPIPLLEEKYYSVSAPSYSAGFEVTTFIIRNGKAIEISIEE